MKTSPVAKIRSFLRRWSELRRLVATLESDNGQLREKIATLQQAKVVAVNQAEALRLEKERLRTRVRSLKKSVHELELINGQLEARLTAYQEAIEKLQAN